jgi:hypothetical protein
LPIAVGSHVGGAVVVTWPFLDQRGLAEFEVFAGDRWRMVPLPFRPAESRVASKILEGPRILVGQGSEVWESDLL